MVGEKKVDDPQNKATENQSLMSTSNIVEKIEEETKDLNVSYNDTSLDGGGLSSPPLRVIKIHR